MDSNYALKWSDDDLWRDGIEMVLEREWQRNVNDILGMMRRYRLSGAESNCDITARVTRSNLRKQKQRTRSRFVETRQTGPHANTHKSLAGLPHIL